MYPCPCGYWQDSEKNCTCSPAVIARYQKRISGPLFDRIDIHVDVPQVDYEEPSGTRQGEPSGAICEARTRRFNGTRLHINADMEPAEVREFCRLDEAGQPADASGHAAIVSLGAHLPSCAQARSHHRPTWLGCLSSARRIRPKRFSTQVATF
jgi:predicted ATPase with chaperone activity